MELCVDISGLIYDFFVDLTKSRMGILYGYFLCVFGDAAGAYKILWPRICLCRLNVLGFLFEFE